MPRARFGTTRQSWRESVVAGTNARRRRHSRLSVRISRRMRLWFTPAFPPQQRGEAPVAVVTVTDSQALEHIPQLYLFPFGSDAPPVPVVTRAADARQRAHPLDGQAALRGRHRVDEREDAVAPRPPLGRGGSLTCRKAFSKKSSSTACWPTLRSSSTSRESRAGSVSAWP